MDYYTSQLVFVIESARICVILLHQGFYLGIKGCKELN